MKNQGEIPGGDGADRAGDIPPIAVFDHLPAGAALLDAGHAVVRMNRRLRAWLGGGLPEAGALHAWRMWPAEDGARLAAWLADDPASPLELPLTAPGVPERMVRLEQAALNGARGLEPGAVRIVLLFDITEEWRFSQTMLRAKNEWECTFDAVPDLVALLDDDRRIVRINRAFARRLGHEPRALIGRHCYELMHGATCPPDDCPVFRMDRDGRPQHATMYSEVLKGYFEVTVIPVTDKRGRRQGMVHVARDVTDVKEAEMMLRRAHDDLERRVEERTQELTTLNRSLHREIEERNEAERALERSRASWKSVVEKITDALLVVDSTGVVQFANQAVTAVFDRPPDAIVGRPSPFAVPAGEPEIIRLSLERGGLRACEIRSIETTWDGRPARLVIVHDITKRTELEAQLRQALKMDAIGRLAGGIAHDFNNLLTSILGFGRLALDGAEPGSTLHADLMEMMRAGERAAKLTGQLLAFGRKQVMQVVSLELNEIVLNMDKLLRRTLGEDIELVTLPGEGLKPIIGDHSSIEQIILNLVVNARDAMPGGGKLTLATEPVSPARIRARHPGLDGKLDYVCLTIRDSGCGIAPEHRERIFEPFFTTKEKDRGTGLGLSMVYGIVKQMRGEITVDSTVGQGATFCVYLPCGETAEKAASTPSPTDSLPRGRETILVVEDEDTVRTLTCRILRNLGYTIFSARNGLEALEMASGLRSPVHLVLSDIVMPHLGGVEMVARLKELRSDFKVLYCSGFAGSKLAGMSEAGAPLLPKPFTREKLARMVRSVLDGEAEA